MAALRHCVCGKMHAEKLLLIACRQNMPSIWRRFAAAYHRKGMYNRGSSWPLRHCGSIVLRREARHIEARALSLRLRPSIEAASSGMAKIKITHRISS